MMVLDELNIQAAKAGRYSIRGENVDLPPKAAEVLGLAIHELATNSIKYGALRTEDGKIDVRWTVAKDAQSPRLRFCWAEFGVQMDDAPTRQGFGTELITQRVPYELGGTGGIEFRPTGIVAIIEFPLEQAQSILQTDAGR
jgi:two-component sensor histidine kinase